MKPRKPTAPVTGCGHRRCGAVAPSVAHHLDAGRITAGAAMREIEAYYERSHHPVATGEPIL